MEAREFFDRMFARVDAMDADGFAGCFTENGVFRMGNVEAVGGRANIREFVARFFDAIRGISHEFQGCWTVGDRAFCNGLCTYVRKDGSELTVPWATVSRFEGGKFAEYLAYVDASKLLTP